jgi:hypothetical protein
MVSNSNEINRWITRFQRKLDSMPLTKLDREELEEMLAIIHNLFLRQLTEEVSETPVESGTRRKRNGGGES